MLASLAVVYGAPAVGLTAATATEALARRGVSQQAERNAFYFLYDANERLASD